jgi:hypothetical protein
MSAITSAQIVSAPVTDLPAGRDLDAEVAEKVMTHPHSQWRDPVPAYSTDIAAAWTVLDAMVWRVGTANVRLDMEDYGRGAGTSPDGAERAVWVTIGDSAAFGPAPEAICRAALWAIGAVAPA